MKQLNSDWIVGPTAWEIFVNKHPELGYKPGRMNFHNFLRHAKKELVNMDAIRMAKHKFWIAHEERFPLGAFEIATSPMPVSLRAAELNSMVNEESK